MSNAATPQPESQPATALLAQWVAQRRAAGVKRARLAPESRAVLRKMATEKPGLFRKETSTRAVASPSPSPVISTVLAAPGLSLADQLAAAMKPAAPARPQAPAPIANPPISSAVAKPAAPSAKSAFAQSVTEQPPLDAKEKETQLNSLRTLVLGCVKCENLVRARTNVVFGVGNINAELMFVGEAPGADEDEQGEPFVGRAGQTLNKMITAMGLSREQVYIANILKCRPDMPAGSSGNRKPLPEEMATCAPYLIRQIEIIRPRVIVALGATAVQGLLGREEPLGKLRGNWLDFRGVAVMPTYHPSYLMQYATVVTKRLAWEDLLAVMTRLGMPISDKQRAFFAVKPE